MARARWILRCVSYGSSLSLPLARSYFSRSRLPAFRVPLHSLEHDRGQLDFECAYTYEFRRGWRVRRDSELQLSGSDVDVRRSGMRKSARGMRRIGREI